ncbi:MAG: FHA domain-containing protein [Deltaproteobacteria bacterium]|nr:FHA domain-containing protein [Deltaproteobacteria bacterium]MBI3295676.1 FHA domain-containing protein [Deltaproteobacteria bacterium]
MESQAQLQPRLVIIEGNEKGKILILKPGTQTVGRSKADVVLNDPRISRSHVSITFDAEQGTLYFSDLNSLNGTQVNGDVKPSGPLKDGDQIQLGDTRLDLQILSVSPEVTAQKHLAEMLKPKDAPAPVEPDNDHTIQLELPKRAGPLARLPRPGRLALVATLAIAATLLVLFTFSGPRPSEMKTQLAHISDLIRQERTDEALAETIQLCAQYPNDPTPQFQLGLLYAKLNKLELAIGAFQKAHQSPQAPHSVHAKLLRLYAMGGAKEGATAEMAHIDKLIQEGPYDKATLVDVALVFLDLREMLGQSLEKSFILAKALQKEVAPQDPIGYKLEAQILAVQGKFQEALPALAKAAELAPQDEWPLENTTFAFLKLGNSEATLASATEWMKKHPASSKPLLVMAYLKMNSGNSLDALPFAQKIVQMQGAKKTDPLYPEALSLMGQIYAKAGQTAEASASLTESCTLGYQPACEYQKTLGGFQTPRENSGKADTSSSPLPTTSATQTPTAIPATTQSKTP